LADFASLPLHDAILRSIMISWPDRECVLRLDIFYTNDEAARPGTLTFSGLTAADLPHQSPWGDSAFVNACHVERPGRLRVEMQSGDVLVFEASAFALSQRV
jgi:hypothetical protein